MKYSVVDIELDKPERRSVWLVIGTAMLAAGVLMVAQADDRQFGGRAYVGAGVGVTQLDPKPRHSSMEVSDNTDTGFHIMAGYDFTTRLAAEVYYANLGAAKIAFLNQDVGQVDYQVFGVSAIGYLFNSRSGFRSQKSGPGLNVREGLSLYGRVGIGGVSADSKLEHTVVNDAHLALGLGAEYGFRNGFAIRGEYMALDADMHYATVSLLKRFGKASSPIAAPLSTRAITAPQVEQPVAETAPEVPSIGPVTTVNFAFDQSVIMDGAAIKLDRVVAALSNTDDKITLEGHTDWVSTESYNLALSLKRVESVRRYLENRGISRSRFVVRGYGETRPVASNSTDEGRARNRRVDIRINR